MDAGGTFCKNTETAMSMMPELTPSEFRRNIVSPLRGLLSEYDRLLEKWERLADGEIIAGGVLELPVGQAIVGVKSLLRTKSRLSNALQDAELGMLNRVKKTRENMRRLRSEEGTKHPGVAAQRKRTSKKTD